MTDTAARAFIEVEALRTKAEEHRSATPARQQSVRYVAAVVGIVLVMVGAFWLAVLGKLDPVAAGVIAAAVAALAAGPAVSDYFTTKRTAAP